MKKTITLPDGSIEVVEGTAEELAEYEQKRKTEGTVKPTKKRRILNEERVRQIAKEEAGKVAPIVIQGHGICTCPLCCPYKPYWIIPDVLQPPLPLPYVGDPLPLNPPWYTITITNTSDKVEMVKTNEMRPEYGNHTTGFLQIQN
jgi:hypothetical protein